MPKVRVSEQTHKEIDVLRKTKTQGEFVDTLINRYKQHDALQKKLHEKDVEIERLRLEKPLESEISQEANPNKGRVDNDHSQEAQNPITNPLDYDCHYRAYDHENGKIYCDGREIPRCVCMNRHGRFSAMAKNCYPKGMKFKRRHRKSHSPEDREERYSNVGGVFEGHEGSGLW